MLKVVMNIDVVMYGEGNSENQHNDELLIRRAQLRMRYQQTTPSHRLPVCQTLHQCILSDSLLSVTAV